MTFEEYARDRGPQLLRVAYLLTQDAHLAQDLVQSTLLEVYKKWSKVQRVENIDAYVRRILMNTFIGWTRRRSWTERPADNVKLLAENEGEGAPDPADLIVGAERLRALVHALTPKARAVLVLRYYLDLEDQVIADHLKIAPSSVRATASRALAALRANNMHNSTSSRAIEEL